MELGFVVYVMCAFAYVAFWAGVVVGWWLADAAKDSPTV